MVRVCVSNGPLLKLFILFVRYPVIRKELPQLRRGTDFFEAS